MAAVLTRRLPGLALIAGIFAVAGCSHSIRRDDPNALTSTDAVVLLAVKAAIPLSEARECGVICTAWYQLDAHANDVYAYPVKVGSTFRLTQVHTTDNRLAPLEGSVLKIERPGVYFYGTIVASYSQVAFVAEPTPAILMEAWTKFAPALSALAPANFTWPSADNVATFHYAVADPVQQRLKSLTTARAALVSIAPAAAPDLTCRLGLQLTPPDQLPYEEYVRRAFNAELAAAGWHDETAGVRWTARLTALKLATTPGAWDLGVTLESPTGGRIVSTVHHTFDAGGFSSGAAACTRAERAWRGAVQALIEQVVASPGFAAFAQVEQQAAPLSPAGAQ